MPQYFDFTVSLQDVIPRPWRRFLIRSTARFAALHSAMQDACGWTNSHLYLFRAAGDYQHDVIAGLRIEDGDDDMNGPVPSAEQTHVARYFGVEGRTTCLYVYDFGDEWTHDVQLNDIVTLPDRFTRRLLGGEHAFPPDDSGGAHRYTIIQKALRTGKDPEGLLDWARDTWDWTGEFDLEKTRRAFDKAPRASSGIQPS